MIKNQILVTQNVFLENSHLKTTVMAPLNKRNTNLPTIKDKISAQHRNCESRMKPREISSKWEGSTTAEPQRIAEILSRRTKGSLASRLTRTQHSIKMLLLQTMHHQMYYLKRSQALRTIRLGFMAVLRICRSWLNSTTIESNRSMSRAGKQMCRLSRVSLKSPIQLRRLIRGNRYGWP